MKRTGQYPLNVPIHREILLKEFTFSSYLPNFFVLFSQTRVLMLSVLHRGISGTL
jgi:hypothetical protein